MHIAVLIFMHKNQQMYIIMQNSDDGDDDGGYLELYPVTCIM